MTHLPCEHLMLPCYLCLNEETSISTLLSKFQLHSNITRLSAVLLLCQDPTQDTAHVLSPLRSVQFSDLFSFFMTMTVLRSSGQVF